MAKCRCYGCQIYPNRFLLLASNTDIIKAYGYYGEPLPRALYRHLEEEHPATLARGAIMLHSNAHSHVVHTAHDKVCSIHWGVYIAQFHVFGSLKKALTSCRFGLYEGVMAVVVQQIQQSREFFAVGMHQLVCQWDASPQSPLGLITSTPPRAIPKRVSFEQAPNIIKKNYLEDKSWKSHADNNNLRKNSICCVLLFCVLSYLHVGDVADQFTLHTTFALEGL
jgi:hypothetical protein